MILEILSRTDPSVTETRIADPSPGFGISGLNRTYLIARKNPD